MSESVKVGDRFEWIRDDCDRYEHGCVYTVTRVDAYGVWIGPMCTTICGPGGNSNWRPVAREKPSAPTLGEFLKQEEAKAPTDRCGRTWLGGRAPCIGPRGHLGTCCNVTGVTFEMPPITSTSRDHAAEDARIAAKMQAHNDRHQEEQAAAIKARWLAEQRDTVGLRYYGQVSGPGWAKRGVR